MANRLSSNSMSHMLTMFAIALTVTALYLMAEVMIPITLAFLLTFLLAPVAGWLEHHRIGRPLSVVLVVLGIFAVVLGLTWVVAGQVFDLAEKLPQYRENIQRKAEALKNPQTMFSRLRHNLQGIGNELSATITTTTATAPTQVAVPPDRDQRPGRIDLAKPAESVPADAEPMPVKVIDTRPPTMRIITNMLGPLFRPMATAGLIIVLIFFMLLHREDLRDRLISLAGRSRLTITAQALNEAGRRISRYLMMQMIVNVTYGIPVGVGLYFIGVPNAMLWGLLATLLRFIPYIGPWLAAAMPILISLAIFDSWTRPAITIAMFIILELISNNVIEPLLYSSSTGISPVALITAAAFWTWMWGPIGLMLATPLTVCLIVLGRHVPQLQFLNVMLSDGPVLEPEVRLYQRLLVLDLDDARRELDKALDTKTLVEVYDAVLLPALRQGQLDRAVGSLDSERFQLILTGMKDIVEDMPEHVQARQKKADPEAPPPPKPDPSLNPRPCIASLGARDDADELAAMMLAQVLEGKGLCVKNVTYKMLADEAAELIVGEHIDIVCISATPPLAELHARYICKRLRARLPDLRIIVGLWTGSEDESPARERLESFCDNMIAVSFSQALEIVDEILPVIRLEEQAEAGPQEKAPAPLPLSVDLPHPA